MISFDVYSVRSQFPILEKQDLIYLDSAATAQKPQSMIDSVENFYKKYNANVHRGVYPLSEQATEDYEASRKAIGQYLNAKNAGEIVFVSGTTGGINLIAQTWGQRYLQPGDEIILTAMEHHSNIVPWQLIAEARQATIRVIPLKGWDLDLEAFEHMLNPKTKLVACTHVSNTLGTINPIEKITSMARSVGAITVIDGAQAVPHMRVDVQALGCDFYVFSGHKLFGPTGIGAVYGKAALWDTLPPYQGGGGMIQKVTFEKTTYKKAPERFEAGTGHIAGAIGLHAAIRFMESIDIGKIQIHEQALLEKATTGLKALPGVRIIGESSHKAGVLSFTIEGVHPHDVAEILARYGVAIRAGHHCNQPLMQYLGLPGTSRASFALYNTLEEIDVLLQGVEETLRLFR